MVKIRDDFGEFRVEKRSQGGSHGRKSQKNLWLQHVWCCRNHEAIPMVMKRFCQKSVISVCLLLSKSWSDFTDHEAILTASVKNVMLSKHKLKYKKWSLDERGLIKGHESSFISHNVFKIRRVSRVLEENKGEDKNN
jgi:hypothetical protein